MNNRSRFKSSSCRLAWLLLVLFEFTSIILFVQGGGAGPVNNEELYKLLGISKTATTKEIRQAFKKIALEMHPDKNPKPGANEAFIKINRAYEILKDDDLRKKYDLYGEDGLKDNQNQGQHYQSWNFYQQNFGIYDDDPQVITLSRADFIQTVQGNTDTIWFINYYSAHCSHCHDLAPSWREVAKQLEGVIKIGAVNCLDDWLLCNEQQIQQYPSLIMYPKRELYREEQTTEKLLKFALSFASGTVHDLSKRRAYVKELSGAKRAMPWLVSFCLTSQGGGDGGDGDEQLNYELNCMDEAVLRKVAIMLHGLVKVATISCATAAEDDSGVNICASLAPQPATPLVFYYALPNVTAEAAQPDGGVLPIPIDSNDYKHVTQTILSLLPDVTQLDTEAFTTILDDLRNKQKKEKPWLIQFVNTLDASSTSADLELRKLPSLLSTNYNFARVDCAHSGVDWAQRFQLSKYPTFVLFKSAASISGANQMSAEAFAGNWYEVYYGTRQTPHDLSAFVKENAHTHVRTLTAFDLDALGETVAREARLGYMIDYFAPWCPPCMSFLPEFRKASKLDKARVMGFGTIDCAANGRLCELHGVRSYPTTMLYNNTVPGHQFHGQHRAEDIEDFIQDVLKPSVISLTYETFHSMVATKPVGQVWLVDFYASWCGPCQQLSPEWRKMAKKFNADVVRVGQVDCVTEQALCTEQAVQSYPNIRVYPSNAHGSSYHEQYQGWMRDAMNLYQWASNYLPSKSHMLSMNNFEQLVLRNVFDANSSGEDETLPWLVDFYAPWCGHCQVFAPVFENLATKLEGRVKCGKVNCQDHQYLCQMVGIRAYPTIRFYPFGEAGVGHVNWQTGDGIEQYDYNGVLSTVEAKLDKYGISKLLTKKKKKMEKEKKKAAAAAANSSEKDEL